MKKQEKQSLRPAEETPAVQPSEDTALAYFGEAPVIQAQEAPAAHVQASEICGIGGCRTVHADWIVMKKHKERVHNVPATRNRNQPKPRNAEIRLA